MTQLEVGYVVPVFEGAYSFHAEQERRIVVMARLATDLVPVADHTPLLGTAAQEAVRLALDYRPNVSQQIPRNIFRGNTELLNQPSTQGES